MKRTFLIIIFLMFNISYASFNDMPQTHWAYHAVTKMKKNNILSGYPDGSFKPNKNITLGEFSTIFTKFFNISPDNSSNCFTDISNTHWAKANVESMRKYIEPNYNSVYEAISYYDYFDESGINANMPVTREIVIYSLYTIFGYDEDLYTDGEEKLLFADYEEIIYPMVTCVAYKNGVISGETVNGKTYIRPQRYITRAEISAMFNNLLGYNDKIINKEGFDVLAVVVRRFLESLDSFELNKAKKYIYDSANILDRIDFDKINVDKLKNIVNLLCSNFSYEVREHGFYSYNHAYLVLDVNRIDFKEFLNDFKIDYESLTTEGLITKINNINFTKNQKFNRVSDSILIEFIKHDNEWKIKL